MTSSSSRKSPDSKPVDQVIEEAQQWIREHGADANWLKNLCKAYFSAGVKHGFEMGMHDAVASSVVKDSRIVRPDEVRIVELPGGKRNG